MTIPPLPRITRVLALLLTPASQLAAQDLPPPPDKTALLQELDRVTLGSQSFVQKRRADAIARIQAASSSGNNSVDLYLAALDGTKYRENHQGLVEWRMKNQDTLHNPSFQNAAQLQLRYLLIGLQRSDQHDALAQVPEALSYLNSLVTLHFLTEPYRALPSKSGMQPPPPPSDRIIPEADTMIKQPLANCPIVEWMQISDLLPQGKDFEPSAGNFAGILEKNIKTPLRKTNDPRLPGAWDLQINTESSVTAASDSQKQAEAFKTVRLPELIFGKLKDTAAIGQPNRAVTEMMALIRGYPANPSVKDWIETARGLLTNQPATPPSSQITLTNAVGAGSGVGVLSNMPAPLPSTTHP